MGQQLRSLSSPIAEGNKISMSEDREGDAVEGDKEDRISDLPRNVIDGILELLPAQDAARTSILSKKWRYTWSELPYLVLDRCFRDELPEKSYSFFVKTVHAILSLHRGDIVKFVLDVPEEPFALYTDIDRWILNVTTNGVKELSLSMSDISDGSRVYELPSCVFNCINLTHLNLCNCVFEPPSSVLAFPKLETLQLEEITVELITEINVPRLVKLDLIHSDGIEHLNIVSPLLELLCVHHVHYLVLNCFMNCKKLKELYIRFLKMADNLKHDERSTLEKLLFGLAPTVEKLCVDPFILQLLTTDRMPKGSLFMFNCVRYLSLMVDIGELSSTSSCLQLITSIPNLSKLEIMVDGTSDNAEAVLKYLNTPACLDQPLNKLKHVVMHWFWGSKIELLFVKLLLAHTPSLVSMNIELVRPGSREERIIKTELVRHSSREERFIITELISFPKESAKAKLFIFQATLPVIPPPPVPS